MGPKSRSLETVFPAGIVRAHSSHTAETTGAYEEMDLHGERIPRGSNSHYRQQYPSPARQDSYGHRIEINDDGVHQSSLGYYDRDRPLLASTAPPPANELQRPTGRFYSSYNNRAPEVPQTERIYYHTPPTNQPERPQRKAQSTPPSSFGEIYKSSGSAVEFATNFEQYLTSCMPSYMWIAIMCLLGLWGLVLIIIGTFNVPFCPSQPMIPIFVIVAGCLYLLWSTLRVYAFWPSTRSGSTLGVDLTCKVLEGIVIVALLVWLFMGCIWVYGPKQYIHFERDYFERNFCNGGVYWIAFVNVTLHLAIIALGLLLLACLLCSGLLKNDR